MYYITLFIQWCFIFSTTAQVIAPREGQWQGMIEYADEDVPFEFNITLVDDIPTVTIINGEEKVLIKNVTVKEDSIFIPLNPFDALIKAKFSEYSMEGEWKKGYRKKGIPFKATYGVPRFKPSRSKPRLSKKWELEFKPATRNPYPGVALLEVVDRQVNATILTEVGDFRYFSGVMKGDSLITSSFDGAHAFLLKVRLSGETMSGNLHFDSGYNEIVEGMVNAEANIPSPFAEVPEGHRPFYDILSAGDPDVKVDEDQYFDKVLVVQLFGTWCPNSMDQTNFLVDWYHEKPEGVEVLAVTYEPNFTTAYGNQRIADYKEIMNVPYNITLGGELSKGQAALSLPYKDKINAFPTLVLVDKSGFIRYEFSYFNGPATGVYYRQFKDQFKKLISQLVME